MEACWFRRRGLFCEWKEECRVARKGGGGHFRLATEKGCISRFSRASLLEDFALFSACSGRRPFVRRRAGEVFRNFSVLRVVASTLDRREVAGCGGCWHVVFRSHGCGNRIHRSSPFSTYIYAKKLFLMGGTSE